MTPRRRDFTWGGARASLALLALIMTAARLFGDLTSTGRYIPTSGACADTYDSGTATVTVSGTIATGSYTITQRRVSTGSVIRTIGFSVASNGTVTYSGNSFAFNFAGSDQFDFTVDNQSSAFKARWTITSTTAATQNCPGSPTTNLTAPIVVPLNQNPCASATVSMPFSFTMNVPARTAAHTLALYKNGVATAYTVTVPANQSTSSSASISGNISVVQGDVLTARIDNVIQSTNTVALSNIGTPEIPTCSAGTYTGTWTTSAYSGTPTPTPAVSATPGATPTPTAPAVTTATPAVTNAFYNNTTTQMNGQNVFLTNPQDIYAPIVAQLAKLPTARDIYDNTKQALDDSGGGDSGSYPSPTAQPTVDVSSRGHLDDIAQPVHDHATTMNTMNNTMRTGINSMADWSSLPTSIGSVTVIDLGSLSYGSTSFPIRFDLTNWMGAINLLRAVLLWLITIGFAVLFLRAATYQN